MLECIGSFSFLNNLGLSYRFSNLLLLDRDELEKLQAHHKSRVKDNNGKVIHLDGTMRLCSITLLSI